MFSTKQSGDSSLLFLAAACIVTVATSLTFHQLRKRQRAEDLSTSSSSSSSPNHKIGSYECLIGNTPLVCLEKLSSLLGQNKKIYVKMESLNPGGTGKDRAALSMIQHAQETNQLPPEGSGSGVVIEGTSGSTGISLAALCASKGYSCIIFMPDDQGEKKYFIYDSFICVSVVYVIYHLFCVHPFCHVRVDIWTILLHSKRKTNHFRMSWGDSTSSAYSFHIKSQPLCEFSSTKGGTNQ